MTHALTTIAGAPETHCGRTGASLSTCVRDLMTIVRVCRVLLLVATCWIALPSDAEAQLFRGRKPVRRAVELIPRQQPAQVFKEVESRINSGNARVVISLSKQRAFVFAGEELYIDTPISSGKRGNATPTGVFTITQKNANHRSNIYGDFVDSRGRVVRAGISLKIDSAPSGTRYVGAPMKYFMRLTDSGVGMHVGILPGYPASHGCIRLPAQIAPLIYHRVKIGTRVTVEP